jgi:hypothetical protein
MVTTKFPVAFVFVGFIGAVLGGCGGSGSSGSSTASDASGTSTSGTSSSATPPSTAATAPPASSTTGTAANVTWTPTAEDPSASTQLAGYHIYYGTSADSMTQVVDVPGAGAVSYSIANLPAGTWYFGVASYDTDKIESTMSEVIAVDL